MKPDFHQFRFGGCLVTDKVRCVSCDKDRYAADEQGLSGARAMDLLGQGKPEQGTMGGAGSDVWSGLVGLVSEGIFLV